MRANDYFAGAAKEFGVGSPLAIVMFCEALYKPRPGIVPGLVVLGAGVAQAHYQANRHAAQARLVERLLAICFFRVVS